MRGAVPFRSARLLSCLSLHFMSKQFQFKLVLLGMSQFVYPTNLIHFAIYR